MSRVLLCVLCGLVLIGGAFAQTANDDNEGCRLSQDGLDSYTFSFWGRAGRFYFIQHSKDLVSWHYFPDAFAPGEDTPNSYGFQVSDADRFFVRLKYLESYTGDPAQQDFDGDKVITVDELADGTDPFSSSDTDGDGIPDDWEIHFGLDPDDPNDATGPTADPDDDGVTNLVEYQTGTLGTDPTDHYNGSNYPGIAIIDWPNPSPTDEPGTLLSAPLILEVTDGMGPVNNARVTVFVPGVDQGQVSPASDGSGLKTTLHLLTGMDGRTQVYYKHPSANPPVPTLRTITAKVGSALPNGNGPEVSVLPTTQFRYEYPANTVGLSASEAIDDRIAAALAVPTDPEDAKRIFSTQTHGTQTYIRNTASWCYNLRQQMTCISPWNSEGQNLYAGTAITAQHIINSAHVELQVGQTVRFITADNVVVTPDRTIVGKARHSAYSGSPNYNNDLTVYTLDSQLPTTITPCKMLSDNYDDYLGYLENGRPPVMVLDQEEKALVSELRELGSPALGPSFAVFVKPGLHRNRLKFYEDLIPGDSGNPAFLIINDSITLVPTLVLLSTATFANEGKGTFVTNLINPTLNDLIVAADTDAGLNTGLHVQTIDLSGFATFTPP